MLDYIGVIPARFQSTRFPGKPLVKIINRPLVIHVAEKAAAALGKDKVFVATEDQRIFNVVEDWGYNAIMTSDKHLTGTDRLWEVAKKIPAQYYLNIQGDEPMVEPKDILKVLDERRKEPDSIVNGYIEIGDKEDPNSVNIPKVIFDEKERMIYMSRKPLPNSKTEAKPSVFYKQVCIYAFNYDELRAFGNRRAKTFLESYEDIEILRFLEMGYPIKMVKMSKASLAVDVPEDVSILEEALRTNL